MSITINGSGDINSSGNDIELQSTSTQDVTLAVGGGSVGVGTATPTEKLTVVGDMSVDTNTLYVDSTNNRVGVGTASPSRQLSIIDSTNPFLQLALSTDAAANNGLEIVMDANGAYFQNRENTPTIFSTNNTERARISDGGNFFVGATAAFNNNVDSGVEIRPASLRIGSNQFVDNIMCCTAHTGTKYFLSFYQNGTFVGSITGNGSNTAFNTSSDYRLKENVVDLDGAIDRVKQIPVRQFNFIDKPDRTVDGFLAHEVQAVVPEAVTGTKDEVDDDGNPKYQGIDQSKLVPLLTQALKDAITKIEALEARVATLESA